MTIDIDWGTKVINVYKVDMVLTQTVPSTIYQLDLDVFRLILKDLEDSSDGMSFERTHSHNAPVTVGGAVLARVIEIKNDYTVTFEDGQYRVETVGANSNIGAVINVNQVSVSTANSAGLQDLNSLQAASFGGEIVVDSVNGLDNVAFPFGTRSHPVKSMSTAESIAETRGIRTFRFLAAMTLTGLDFSDGHRFLGESASTVVLTVDSSADVTSCEFENLTLQGDLDSGVTIRNCAILDITNFNGFMFQSALFNTVEIGGSSTALILSCYSGIPLGTADPFIDMGDDDTTLIVRDWNGGMQMKNLTGSNGICLDFNTGTFTIDASCTTQSVNIPIRGTCKLVNNGSSTVIDNRMYNDTVWDYSPDDVADGSLGEKVNKGLTRNQFIALK